jgi:PmbA protein
MDIALQLLELAKKSGAQAAEVYQSTATAHPVFFETNRLKQLETSQSEGLALRVWRNGCPGLAVAYGLVEPELLVAQSLALCALNEPETPELTPGSTRVYPTLGRGMEVEKLIEMGKQAIEIVRSSFPEVSCTGQWDSEVETVRLVNSLGLDYQYADTTLSGFIDAEWVRGDDFLSVGETYPAR